MKHSQGRSAQQGIDAAQLWLIIMVILAFMASIIMLISGSATALRLALVSALWAAALGFLLVNRYKKTADATRVQLAEQRKRSRVDADRREAEFEAELLRIEKEMRSSLEMEYQKRHADDVAALRAIRREVSRLRATLEAMGAGDFGAAEALHEVESKEVLEIESRHSTARTADASKDYTAGRTAEISKDYTAGRTAEPSHDYSPAHEAEPSREYSATQSSTAKAQEQRSDDLSTGSPLSTTPISHTVFTRWAPPSSSEFSQGGNTTSSPDDGTSAATSFSSTTSTFTSSPSSSSGFASPSSGFSSASSSSSVRDWFSTASTEGVPTSVPTSTSDFGSRPSSTPTYSSDFGSTPSSTPSPVSAFGSASSSSSISTPVGTPLSGTSLTGTSLSGTSLSTQSEDSEFNKMWEDAAKAPARSEVQVEQVPTESVSKHRRPEATQVRKLESVQSQGGRRRKGEKTSGVSVEELMRRGKKL